MTEKTKNYLGWVLIIGVLLVAVAAWRYVGAYSRSIQPGSYRSFAVSGEGRAIVVPDIAAFTFGVVSEGGNDIAKLQTDNTNKVNKAIAFLKAQGIDEKDIQTENYNLSPRYQNVYCTVVCPPATIVGYSINQTVAVKIRDENFAKIGAIMSGVVAQGANTVSQLNFTVDDPTVVENEAREEAIAKAEAKAEAVADAADFDLGELISIDEGGYMPYYTKDVRMEAAMGMGGDMAAPAPSIQPGSQEVVVSVTLRYEIK